ncbi:MAG: DNA polymerase, partial [Nitrospira sp.]|nr:DNA polymerase [Nitrospira sp.]
LFGPVRWTDGVVPKPFEEARAEWKHVVRYFTHKALNSLIQGTAADIMKMAMVKVYEAGFLPHLTIHDELCFSVDSARDESIREIAHIMEHAVELLVPHKVDAKVGPDWGHLEDVK